MVTTFQERCFEARTKNFDDASKAALGVGTRPKLAFSGTANVSGNLDAGVGVKDSPESLGGDSNAIPPKKQEILGRQFNLNHCNAKFFLDRPHQPLPNRTLKL